MTKDEKQPSIESLIAWNEYNEDFGYYGEVDRPIMAAFRAGYIRGKETAEERIAELESFIKASDDQRQRLIEERDRARSLFRELKEAHKVTARERERAKDRVAELESAFEARTQTSVARANERDEARAKLYAAEDRITKLEAEIEQWKAGKYITTSAAVRMVAEAQASLQAEYDRLKIRDEHYEILLQDHLQLLGKINELATSLETGGWGSGEVEPSDVGYAVRGLVDHQHLWATRSSFGDYYRRCLSCGATEDM